MPRNGVLHAKTYQRRGKQQHAINNLLAFFLRTKRQRHAQHAKNKGVGDQEQLAAQVILRSIVLQPPQTANAKGKQQAEQIQLPPVLPDANGENADREQKIEREKCDMTAAAGGKQQRREIAAKACQHRQAECLLQNSQTHARRANRHQQRKC